MWDRLLSHDTKKDFWTWVVVFVSKDANLTKAHVRWLEAALVRQIKDAKRAEVKNGNEPVGGHLPEADTADMKTYLEHVRLLLPTLGANVFAGEGTTTAGTGDRGPIFELKWGEASAECVVLNGQFVVTKGSTARAAEADGLPSYLRDQRRRLIESGVLAAVAGNKDVFAFTQDWAFDSPSAAAAVVCGTGISGPAYWKTKGDGVSYKEWQERRLTGGTPLTNSSAD